MPFFLVIFHITSGCNITEETSIDGAQIGKENKIENISEEKSESNLIEKVIEYEGKPSIVLDQVYTTDTVMALTLNGVTEDQKMYNILDELSKTNITATFFLDQKQVQENTKVVKAIVDHGHTIGISVFNQQDLSEKSYEDIYSEVKLSIEMIEKHTGIKPAFTRTKPWGTNKDLELITAQLEMDAVIGHSIRPRSRDLENTKDLSDYFAVSLSRGGIISLDVNDYPQVLDSIHYIVEEANTIDYSIVPLATLVNNGEIRKPFEEIEGHDLIRKNLDYVNEVPNILYSKDTTEKVVALTFDDYGSDKTVLEILNILESHDIQSTFFLKAKNVERNPNLARVILDKGHEIASHSYAHHRSTDITPEELQDDLIKAHKVITEAIQEKPTMLFRPPFGNIDDESAKVMSAVGFKNIAMYDLSSYDWNPDYTVDDVVNRVMNGVKPGSSIVMHILDDINNIESLPIIIDKLKAEGYSFEKMSKWFEE